MNRVLAAVATVLIALVFALTVRLYFASADPTSAQPIAWTAPPSQADTVRPGLESDDATDRSGEVEPERSTEALGDEPQRASIANPRANITLHGRVLDARTMNGIAGASLSMFDAASAIASRGTTTDSDGAFSVDKIAPGTWGLRVAAAEHRSQFQEVQFKHERQRHQINFLLQPDSILAVQVVLRWPPSNVVEDAITAQRPPSSPHLSAQRAEAYRKGHMEQQDMLQLSLVQSSAPLVDGWTDAGARVIATLGRSTGRTTSAPHFNTFDPKLELSDPRPFVLNACLGRHVFDSQSIAPDDKGVTLQVDLREHVFPRADVRVTAIDAVSGAPLTGASGMLRIDRRFDPSVAKTDSSGSMRFEDLIRGARELVLIAPGYELLREEVAIDTSPETDLGTRRLAPATWVSGRVIGDGAPRDSVYVSARSLAAHVADPFAPGPERVVSRADGSFRIESVAHGKQLVRTENGAWKGPPLIVDTSSGPVEGITLYVSKCADARFWFDAPLAESTLWVADDQQLPVFEDEFSSKCARIVPLAPGRYTWRVESHGKKTAPRPFVVTEKGAEVEVGL